MGFFNLVFDSFDMKSIYITKMICMFDHIHNNQCNSKLILPVVGQSTSSTPGLQQSLIQSVDVSSGIGHSVGYTVSTSVVFHVRHFFTCNLNRFTIYHLTLSLKRIFVIG